MIRGVFFSPAISVAVLWSSGSHPLGLGEIRVESTLASPLEASISLNGIERIDLDPDLFSIRLESQLKQKLLYRLERTDSNTASIILYTQRAIIDPIFQFHLEVEWDKGKVSRSYNVLIDPAGYTTNTPTQGTSKLASTATDPNISEPVAIETIKIDQVADEEMATSNDTGKESTAQDIVTYGPTIDGNSLWRVANNVQTSRNATSIYQWMYGIWEANPSAFMQSNMHQLKIGELIVVPPERKINGISRALAFQTYSDHLALIQSTTPVETVKTDIIPVPEEKKESVTENVIERFNRERSFAELQIITEILNRDLQVNVTPGDYKDDASSIHKKESLSSIEDTIPVESSILVENAIIEEVPEISATKSQVKTQPSAVQPGTRNENIVPSESLTNTYSQFSSPQKINSQGSVFALIKQNLAKINDFISNASGWITMLVGSLFTLLIVVLSRGGRRKPALQDSLRQTNPIENVNSNDEVPDIGNDIDNTNNTEEEESSDNHWPSIEEFSEVSSNVDSLLEDNTEGTTPSSKPDRATEDVSTIIAEADVLLIYGDTDKAVDLLQKTIELRPDKNELNLHLLKTYYKSRQTDEFESLILELKDEISKLDSSQQTQIQMMYSDLCPDSDPIIEISRQSINQEPGGEPQKNTSGTENLEPSTDRVELPSNNDELEFSLDEPELAENAKAENGRDKSLDTLELFVLDDNPEIDDDIDWDQINERDDIETFAEPTDEPVAIVDNVSIEGDETLIEVCELEGDMKEAFDKYFGESLDHSEAKADVSTSNELEVSDDILTSEISRPESSSSLSATEENGDKDDPTLIEDSTIESKSDKLVQPTDVRILHFPDIQSADKEPSEFETQITTTLQSMRDQIQQMSERLFTQERENHRLRSVIDELTGTGDLLSQEKQKDSK
jgi:pilus assembly protein FimV